MPAHTRGCNETSQLEILQLLPIQIRPLHLLASPMEASSISTVVHAVHIGRHDILVMFDLAVKEAALRPWDASIGDENVEAATKFVHDLIDYFFDMRLASDIYLVCSA